MFNLPKDIEKDLIEKYPDIPIKSIVNSLFQRIIEKTLNDGSCTIRSFGKFISFVTFSGKLGRDVVRFKFKLSPTFNKKIRDDDYLIKTHNVRARNTFGEIEKERIIDDIIQKRKIENAKAVIEAGKQGSMKTRERLIEKTLKEMIVDGVI
jgi:hypothetical protein